MRKHLCPSCELGPILKYKDCRQCQMNYQRMNSRQYYQNNRESCLIRNRASTLRLLTRNPDYEKDRRAKNLNRERKDRINQNAIIWRRKNKERYLENHQRARLKMRYGILAPTAALLIKLKRGIKNGKNTNK
jgi:hypothetical protein